VGTTSRASRYVEVTYTGRAAHAAVAPHEGVDAADACVVAQIALGLLRQHLPDGTRLHGIVTEGGARSNIVPGRARMSRQLRSDTLAELEELWPRVRACCEAGALATGCELTLTEPTPAYADLRQDAWLSERYVHHARLRGRSPARPASVGASTDRGNISQVMPSLHTPRSASAVRRCRAPPASPPPPRAPPRTAPSSTRPSPGSAPRRTSPRTPGGVPR
jgi:metal-dependent amidase/aminoacylase/carboxypeptidase family protein